MTVIAPQILVVEDNRDNMTLIAYLLRAYGVEPVMADSGEEGVRLAFDLLPDLILLDIRMPGMDGFEVAAAIKGNPELHDAKVVAVTASAMIGDRERIAAAGFDGYIQKPLNPETFMGSINSFLTGSGTLLLNRGGSR